MCCDTGHANHFVTQAYSRHRGDEPHLVKVSEWGHSLDESAVGEESLYWDGGGICSSEINREELRCYSRIAAQRPCVSVGLETSSIRGTSFLLDTEVLNVASHLWLQGHAIEQDSVSETKE